jgi:ABC-type nitrate/sulfonate/bicarbonate transport system substrate-binding protein
MALIATRRSVIAGAAAVAVTGRARAQSPTEIKIALSSSSMTVVAPRLAEELGFFAQHGIRTTYVILDSASAAASALIGGSVQCASVGATEVVFAQARGQQVVATSIIYAGPTGTLVLAKSVVDKLGIPVTAPVAQRLKAIDGLLIAAPSPTAVYAAIYRSATKSVGATPKFTYMSQPAMVAALASGAIEGFVAGAPSWAISVAKGQGVEWISAPRGQLPAENTPATTGLLAMMGDTIKANPGLVKSVNAALADLGRAVADRPAEVKAAIAKLYPDTEPATLDLLYAAEASAWNAPAVNLKDMERDIAFMKSTGAQVPDVDPAKLIYVPK